MLRSPLETFEGKRREGDAAEITLRNQLEATNRRIEDLQQGIEYNEGILKRDREWLTEALLDRSSLEQAIEVLTSNR